VYALRFRLDPPHPWDTLLAIWREDGHEASSLDRMSELERLRGLRDHEAPELESKARQLPTDLWKAAAQVITKKRRSLGTKRGSERCAARAGRDQLQVSEISP
jgi:hypothetical protein